MVGPSGEAGAGPPAPTPGLRMRIFDVAYRSRTARSLAKRVLPLIFKSLPERVSERLRLLVESVIYRNVEDVHDLPEAFHYWSEHHLLPHLKLYGFADSASFYADQIERVARRIGCREVSIASLGSGNAAVELVVDARLREKGIACRWELVELSPFLQDKVRSVLTARDELARFRLCAISVERWEPNGSIDVVVANQFLHHVVGVDRLIGRLAAMIPPHGALLSHDVIGRNGHRLWPNALRVVQEVWPTLPNSKKIDPEGVIVDPYFDVDCSAYSLEGVEAERILPALLEHMQPEVFVAFGGVVLAFIDRRFGRNFDPNNPEDREFIDILARRDWDLLHDFSLAPTQMFGVFRTPGASEIEHCWNICPFRAAEARSCV